MDRGPSGSSGYGRACANCQKAKCRCVPRSQADGCQRCYRLRKICTPAKSVRYRPETPPPPQHESRTTSTPLEAKLEKLVTLLQDQQEGRRSHPPEPSSLNEGSNNHGTRVDIGSSSAAANHGALPSPGSEPGVSYFNRASPTDDNFGDAPRGIIFPCAGEPNAEQAEEYFTIFTTKMQHFLPFVHIPHGMKSQELKQRRPFLWLCIMCAACNSTVRQQTLGDSIRQIISREIFYHNDRSVDKLLGLLVFVSWSYYQAHCMRYMTDLMQLAMSLVYDLGLNRPTQRPRGLISFKPAIENKRTCSRILPLPRGIETMEDRRGVLGCFLLSSMIETIWKRIDALRWTPHMDETLNFLSQNPECLGDELLVAQVKIQLILNQVNGANCTFPFGNSLYDEVQPHSESYLVALLSQVKTLKNELPPEIASNTLIVCRIQAATIVINEALLGCQSQPSLMSNLSRIERFHTCLSEVSSWYNVFIAIPPENYVGFTLFFMLEMGYSLLILARFTITADPAWDPLEVRKAIDLVDVCDRIAEKYQAAAEISRIGGRQDGDFFGEYTSILKRMAKIWGTEASRLEERRSDAVPKDDGLTNFFLSPDMFLDFDSAPMFMDILHTQ